MKHDLPKTPPPQPAQTANEKPKAAPTPQSADDRSTTFRPVEGGSEMQSGEKLLVEAYAVIWIVLFALVLLSWRRQKKIDERVQGLEAALAAARRAPQKAAHSEAGED